MTCLRHDQVEAVLAIQADAAKLFRVSVKSIVSRQKRSHIVRARFAAIWTARRTTTLSYPEIGFSFDCRDHSSILHGDRRAEQIRSSDDEFRSRTNELRRLAEERKAA